MQSLGVFGPSGFTIAVAVIAIMLAIGGIVLGLGYAFSEDKLKEFGKEEVYQCLINGVLVVGLMALLAPGGVVMQFINSATSNANYSCPGLNTSNSAICFAYGYLVGSQPYVFENQTHTSVLAISTTILTTLIEDNFILGTLSSLGVNLAVSFSFGSAFAPILHMISTAVTELGYIPPLPSNA